MKIISFYTENGEPKSGLTPVITITRLTDNIIVVNSYAMTELSNGFYAYDFSSYTEGHEYTIFVDGGNLLSNFERYKHEVINKIDIYQAIDFIRDIEGGRWKIVNNQMIFYKSDNITEITRFDLKDSAGNATEVEVMDRVKI